MPRKKVAPEPGKPAPPRGRPDPWLPDSAKPKPAKGYVPVAERRRLAEEAAKAAGAELPPPEPKRRKRAPAQPRKFSEPAPAPAAPDDGLIHVRSFTRRRLPAGERGPRYVARVPPAWVETYLLSLDSGAEQLSLRDEIALLDSMTNEVLSRLTDSLAAPDGDDAAKEAAYARTALMALVEQRRKLVDSEARNNSMMAAEVVQQLLRRVVDVLGAHVSDRAVLTAVARDLRGILADYRMSTGAMVLEEAASAS